MAVWALGINHTTAPLDMRGRFAFAMDQIGPHLSGLRQSLSRSPEAAIVSTCNRTEVYCAGDEAELERTLAWLAHSGGVNTNELRSHAYVLQDAQAARHAFRVASGLDSMVLGEPQILGQMKDAVRAAEAAGALGSTLNAAVPAQRLRWPRKCARQPRSAPIRISMAAAAVRLAGNLFEDLGKVRVLFVGAGDMIELRATHFRRQDAAQDGQLPTARWSAARKLAARFGAEVMHLADLPDRLHEFDVHRHQLHRQHAAHRRPGRGRARAQEAQAPPDVHARPGRAARHRARGPRTRRCLPVHRRRPGPASCKPRRPAAKRPWRRPKRLWTPACRALCTG